MKTSKPVFILGLAALIAFAAFAAESPQSSTSGSRFQLVPAKIQTISMLDGRASGNSADAMFKIDTATGETWIFVSMNIDYKQIEGWQKLSEFNPKEKFTLPGK